MKTICTVTDQWNRTGIVATFEGQTRRADIDEFMERAHGPFVRIETVWEEDSFIVLEFVNQGVTR